VTSVIVKARDIVGANTSYIPPSPSSLMEYVNIPVSAYPLLPFITLTTGRITLLSPKISDKVGLADQ
jgi:hypothetical protein